ncbi:CocE/NonD family hydrolase [Iningainema tapete]|uniref:CocE/NonD family hydrolase n=1 Tax=Iningainema tapete BLCC-T55 TaxID=2748662 RepID=A0A8J6XCX8_9CYAN|nr:CocE/NonD family hydrolase [Iningainema tapete]MBD2772779.1 CocE/NonD family hydrolase [Iningainema tapete BLCC-T55]
MLNHFKWCKSLSFVGVFTISLVLLLTFANGSSIYQKTLAFISSNYPRNQALYVTAEDGTKIAIDVWLPKVTPGSKIPTLMRTTPYYRATELVDKSKQNDPNATERNPYYLNPGYTDYFNKAGYAVVLVDARGTGASFGNLALNPSTSKNEIQDYNAVVNWIIAQPWSNQKVGAFGTSADGSTAEFLTVTNNPAVKAVVPVSFDFDFYAQQYFPGGVFVESVVKGIQTKPNLCNLQEFEQEPACQEFFKTGFKGPKPVDEDKDKQLLRAAFQQQTNNFDFFSAAQKITYRDDLIDGLGGITEDFSIYKFKEDIERSNVAIYHWASWFDAGTAEGVLNHFMAYSNPQKAILGPWTHGAYSNANPFVPADTPVNPSREEQLADIVNFFDAYLKDNNRKPKLKREIKYYTMGEEKWKTTTVWPPKGMSYQRLFFAENNGLTEKSPTSDSEQDKYIVNFEATTGPDSRWRQSFEKMVFPNRTEEDKKLLTYTSEPLRHDVEITGHPVVTLYVTSTANDGAFFVYLEDVDENGNITYITEGQLRPIHRKISNESPPYVVFGPYHSFKREDSLPFEPGKVTELSFNLLPTSVQIQRGHRIRVAIAGHDKDLFTRYPAVGTPEISILRNVVNASYIDLPVMKRRNEHLH